MAQVASAVEYGEGEYEALRAANMKRNQEIMRALGLDMSDFQLHREHKEDSFACKGKGGAAAPRKRKAAKAEDAPTSSPGAVRKSARIRGAAPEHAGKDLEQAEEDDGKRVQTIAAEHLHDAAERDHLRWAGKQGKSTIVGTASYKHTLHRVRSWVA
jgi:hypothetical protein